MLDVLLILGVLYSGFVLGQMYQLMKVRKTIEKIATQNNIDLSALRDTEDEEDEVQIVLLQAEEVNNTLLIYDKLTNEFICQGSDIEDAAKKFNERKKDFYGLIRHNDQNLMFIDGKIKTKNES